MNSSVNGSSADAMPVAAYARMSTETQDHSIQHQLDAINQYTQARAMTVMRTFVDEGRTGLTLQQRPGLQALLTAATAQPCLFRAIVVYDISRWGRFQDVDESAFYEYLCRRAGVTVLYCAEPFSDDGSPMQALVKSVKRIMAAEYSRELSAKVWQAQCRFSRMGFKQGGLPGFGLCRVPVTANGTHRSSLRDGERKPAVTDRVALAPTTEADIRLVRRIYAMYLKQSMGDSAIAARLRAEGRVNHLGKPWDAATVRRILTSEKYCGELVFNRTTRRLRTPVAANPASAWVRCDSALMPMVSRATFDAAMSARAQRSSGPDRESILNGMRAIVRQYGTINVRLCRAAGLPGKTTVQAMFGGYIQAYAAAGLPDQRTQSGCLGVRSARALILALRDQAHACAERAGAAVSCCRAWNVLILNDRLRVRLSVASCRCYPDTQLRWRIPAQEGEPADFVLCGMLDGANQRLGRYVLLPLAQCARGSLFLAEKAMAHWPVQHFTSLNAVFGLAPDNS
ncbi:recombinase family protein [Pseudoduganella lutea]|uniref:Recombinase family protein n=1 Tax=Pseudoduganella lutea TaxID=321985 RepID=A0A4P6L4M2_9BURK|nr:recombinase family protein [Pseudoduganella lutea]QBE66265.1 recombinase family protein [Pseudoduganella lutea]